MNAYTILVLIALLLAIIGLISPKYPLVAVSVLLLCIALLINTYLGKHPL